MVECLVQCSVFSVDNDSGVVASWGREMLASGLTPAGDSYKTTTIPNRAYQDAFAD